MSSLSFFLFCVNFKPEMKLVVAAIYSNFRTSIVNDDGIEEIDAYTIRPTSNQLVLRFTRIERE
jgi:hypothetical protein